MAVSLNGKERCWTPHNLFLSLNFYKILMQFYFSAKITKLLHFLFFYSGRLCFPSPGIKSKVSYMVGQHWTFELYLYLSSRTFVFFSIHTYKKYYQPKTKNVWSIRFRYSQIRYQLLKHQISSFKFSSPCSQECKLYKASAWPFCVFLLVFYNFAYILWSYWFNLFYF